jgi:hypothetical protein
VDPLEEILLHFPAGKVKHAALFVCFMHSCCRVEMRCDTECSFINRETDFMRGK